MSDPFPPCFAPGTRIMTLQGEVPVEELRRGDLVVTLSGRGAPVKRVAGTSWREVDVTAHLAPELVRPVRIAREAFGAAMPRRDLVIPPNHAVRVEGVRVESRQLVNDATVAPDMEARLARYVQVELHEPDMLLAEGVPAECGPAPETALPDPPAEAVAGLRRLLANRLPALGYVPSEEPDLRLLVDGAVLPPVTAGNLRARFALPPLAQDVRLLSRRFTPADTAPESGDLRVLGVCLEELQLVAGDAEIALPLERLEEGVHPVESNGAARWRWTDGAARLPADLLAPGGTLAVRLLWPGRYWVAKPGG